MTLIRTPVHVHKEGDRWQLVDSTAGRLAESPADYMPEEVMQAIAQRVNAYDALMEVAKDAYSLAEDRTDTAPEPCEDTGLLALMIAARGALDAVKETP